MSKYILLLTFLAFAHVKAHSQTKTDLLLIAESSWEKGDTTQALKQFHDILRVYPQSFTAAKRLAEIYLIKNEYGPAVQYCNIALDVTDNYQAQADEALKTLTDSAAIAIEKDKIAHYIDDRASIHHLKGNIRLKQMRTQDAIKEYKASLELVNSTEASIDLALVYLEIGFSRDAIGILQQVINKEPDHARGYFNLANVYNKLQMPDSAFIYYDKAIERDPDLKWPYLYQGRLLTKNEKFEKAVESYDHFIALDSTNEEVYFRRAVLKSELRNWSSAVQDWQKVLSLNPNNADAWRNQGLSYFQMANYDSAIMSFDQALKFNPEESYTYINRGYSYYLKGEPKKALEDLDYGLKGLKNYYLGYYFRALTLHQLGKKKDACEDIQKALSLGMKQSAIEEKVFKKCF
ncbi:tetratricopeptide repeat protein [Fulvivirga ligni]|uniref:tetratricopeptide repeat protein n=1 Tax=Fulvivirga ligni TaxID=2904246 RepID=UPI001F3025DE|nr:tetratricopeptide repeat protein [Fulvivirga ligni]UII20173.1 tetratricopeptide repeat protein [Fulvivirga ligni]